jgi:hypothetical protein
MQGNPVSTFSRGGLPKPAVIVKTFAVSLGAGADELPRS